MRERSPSLQWDPSGPECETHVCFCQKKGHVPLKSTKSIKKAGGGWCVEILSNTSTEERISGKGNTFHKTGKANVGVKKKKRRKRTTADRGRNANPRKYPWFQDNIVRRKTATTRGNSYHGQILLWEKNLLIAESRSPRRRKLRTSLRSWIIPSKGKLYWKSWDHA